MTIPISPIYEGYADRSGNPLQNGSVYIGIANQNPVTAPIACYWDFAMTQPALQPLRTSNGFIYRSGTPTNVFVGSDYSESVYDINGALVTTTASAAAAGNYPAILQGANGSSTVGFIQAGTGAVAYDVQTKLRESTSVVDRAANGTSGARVDPTGVVNSALGIAANTTYIQSTVGGGTNDLLYGTYKSDTGQTINLFLSQLQGKGAILDFSAAAAGAFTALKFNTPVTAGHTSSDNASRWSGGYKVKTTGDDRILMQIGNDTQLNVNIADYSFQHIALDGGTNTNAVGIRVANDAWGFRVENYSIENVATQIQYPSSSGNSGERMQFINGVHSGTGTAYVSNNDAFGAIFEGCSFDSSMAFSLSNRAAAYTSHCHFENQVTTATDITIDGAGGGVSGSLLVIQDSIMNYPGGVRTAPLINLSPSNLNGPNGGIIIRNTKINFECNTTTSKYFCAETLTPNMVGMSGITRTGFSRAIAPNTNAWRTAPSRNLLGDPQFATGLQDWVIVGTPVRTIAVGPSGAYGVVFTGAGGGQDDSMTHTVPCRPGQQLWFSWQYKRTALVVGGSAFNTLAANILFTNGAGTAVNTSEFDLTSGTDAAYVYKDHPYVLTTYVPIGAVYVGFQFRMIAATSGTATIGDIFIDLVDA